MTIHASLADGRWLELSLVEQLANVGSEVGRACRARSQGNEARFEAALARALELFDITLADRRWGLPRLREIARARETTVDFLVGDNAFDSSAISIDRYFTPFAVAARTARSHEQPGDSRAGKAPPAGSDEL